MARRGANPPAQHRGTTEHARPSLGDAAPSERTSERTAPNPSESTRRRVPRVMPSGRLHRADRQPQPSHQRSSCVVDCGIYTNGCRQAGETDYRRAYAQVTESGEGFVWLGLLNPGSEELTDIAEVYGLHPLTVEDALVGHPQRPKLERYSNSVFLILKTAWYIEHDELTATSDVVHIGDVMMFVGQQFFITVRHGPGIGLSETRSLLEEQNPDLMKLGPWAVCHAVTDNVVDRYGDVVAALEDDVDEVEADVFGRQQGDIARIYHLKREVLEFKRAVVPLIRPLQRITSGEVPEVPEEIRRYFRDIADHTARDTDQVVGFDDLLNSILQSNLAQVGIQQNNDMRKISAWVAILAVPTMIAGIYGMNFHNMPELKWHYGYFIVLLVMLVVCLGLYGLFKRSKWL